MTDEQITISTWEATPSQLWAVRCRAKCYTQRQTAEIVGVEERTMRRWCAMPEFDMAVRELQIEMMETFDDDFDAFIQDALRVDKLALAGEIPADDPRAILAHDTVKAVLFPLARRRGRDGVPPPPEQPAKQLPPPNPAA